MNVGEPPRPGPEGQGPAGDDSGRAAPVGRRSRREGPSLLEMIGFVAALVAGVILVFFAIGYLIGRLFL